MSNDITEYTDEQWDEVIRNRIDLLIEDLIDAMNHQLHLHDWGPREVAKKLYKLDLYYEYLDDEDKRLLDIIIEVSRDGKNFNLVKKQ